MANRAPWPLRGPPLTDGMTDSVKWLLFGGLTAIAIFSSRHAWQAKQSYGFYRFVGFEAIVVLVVMSTSKWFREPLSLRQITSWVLFAIATALAAHGIRLLRVVGMARSRVMEDTQTVVESGVYRYIRHPLYFALILFAWGVFLKNTGISSGVLAAAATCFMAATARSEERFNLERFGVAYTEYMSRTRMFVPFLL